MRDYRKLPGLKNLFLLLFVLSFSFVFISCGNGPMSKVGEPEITVEAIDNGDFSLDFNITPPDTGDADFGEVSYVALGRSIESMAGMEFTIEAWVKRTVSNSNSTIFARGGDDEGFIFFIANNRPYFLIKDFDRDPNIAIDPAYVVYAPGPSNLLASNVWMHIATVFTTEDHTAVHGDCVQAESVGAFDDDSHLDMYVNGVWQNCGLTGGSQMAALDAYTEFIGRAISLGQFYQCTIPSGGSLCTNTYVPSTDKPGQIIVDELRFWGTARDEGEIDDCYDAELGVIPPCSIDNTDLLSYWKFDDEDDTVIGPSINVTDSALDQNNGILEYCDHNCGSGTATSIIWDCDELANSNPGVLCNNPWVDNTGTTWQ